MSYSTPDDSERDEDMERYENTIRHAEQNFIAEIARNRCPSKDIEEFEILAKLRKGGFAEVYRAESDDTPYAIKTLTKALIRERQVFQGTIREKKFLFAMNNPFVVKVHFKFKDAVRVYMMMDYAPYGDLLSETKIDKISEERTIKYAFQIALGLQYVHACGVVLRDLKPENILIFKGGRLKLADFGLAKLDDGTLNTASGTTAYMAPEMIKKHIYSEAVDWWAFGITLYQLMLNGFPFGGTFRDNEKVLTRSIVAQPLQGLEDSILSEDGRNIIRQLLRRIPSERLGSRERGAEAVLGHPWFEDCDRHRWIFAEELVNLGGRRPLRGQAVEAGIFEDLGSDEDDLLSEDLADF